MVQWLAFMIRTHLALQRKTKLFTSAISNLAENYLFGQNITNSILWPIPICNQSEIHPKRLL